MIECFSPEVRDFLPDLVHGKLGEIDTATLLAHIEACDACAAELALLREVRASAPIAPEIDAARVVSALSVRSLVVPVEPPRPRAGRSPLWKFVASAAVLVSVAVAGTQLGRDASLDTPRVAGARASAESMSYPVQGSPVPSLALVSAVQDLTDAQVETLLTQLDEIEAIPSADPEQGSVSVDADSGASE